MAERQSLKKSGQLHVNLKVWPRRNRVRHVKAGHDLTAQETAGQGNTEQDRSRLRQLVFC